MSAPSLPSASSLDPVRGTGVQARSFDVLFRRALGGRPGLAEALRTCGYDPEHPQEVYPSRIWVDCLEMARSLLFDALSHDDGLRELGKLFADGFATTPLGQVYQGIAYTGRAYLLRLPKLIRMARSDLQVDLQFETDQRCMMVVRGPDPNAAFTAGLVEVRLRQRGLNATVRVAHSLPEGYDLAVSW
jgi:uncharacterized protein (TIGR02265 family)